VRYIELLSKLNKNKNSHSVFASFAFFTVLLCSYLKRVGGVGVKQYFAPGCRAFQHRHCHEKKFNFWNALYFMLPVLEYILEQYSSSEVEQWALDPIYCLIYLVWILNDYISTSKQYHFPVCVLINLKRPFSQILDGALYWMSMQIILLVC